jgi:hypothetical protein
MGHLGVREGEMNLLRPDAYHAKFHDETFTFHGKSVTAAEHAS